MPEVISDPLIPKRGHQIIATIGANLGSCALGSAVGWSSPAHKLLKEKFNIVDDTELSLVSSIVLLGAAIAQLYVFLTFGSMRTMKSMQTVAFPIAFGWIVVLFATSTTVLCIGRFITGFFGGVLCIAAPTYTGEIADKNIRGRLTECYQLFVCAGQLFPFVLGEFHNFNILTIPLIGIPIISFSIIIFLPESPVYFLSKNKTDEAKKSLSFYRGIDYDITEDLADLGEYAGSIHVEHFWASFMTRGSLKGFFMLVGLHLCQQFSGIKSLMFFAHPIFEMAGSKTGPGINAIILMTMKLLFTFVSLAAVDKVGRRKLMVFSLLIEAISLFTVGMYFTVQKNNPSFAGNYSWMPLTFFCLYISGYSIGSGPIPWAMLSELLPISIKIYAGPTVSTINWLAAYVVTRKFPFLIVWSGPNCVFFYVFYSLCSGNCFRFVMRYRNKRANFRGNSNRTK